MRDRRLENPYHPPRADVFDIPVEDTRIERPQHVFYAVALLWLNLVIQAVGLAFMWHWFRVATPEFLIVTILTTAIWILNACLVAMIERGRNWARITYLVLFLLNAPLLVTSIWLVYRYSMISAGSAGVQLLLQTAAQIMLFVPPAGAWFRGARV